jgi:hypothetical protein
MVFEIAALHADWRWRSGHKPSIITGRKQRGHLTELRNTQNQGAKVAVSVRRELIEAMLFETQRTSGALDQWLKKQLSERHKIEVSERTIRSDRKALGG